MNDTVPPNINTPYFNEKKRNYVLLLFFRGSRMVLSGCQIK